MESNDGDIDNEADYMPTKSTILTWQKEKKDNDNHDDNDNDDSNEDGDKRVVLLVGFKGGCWLAGWSILNNS